MDIAEKAYDNLSEQVDTIIVIPNDRILSVIEKATSLLDSFTKVDDVLRQGVQGISELITVPGLINVDFADVKAIMTNTGTSLMGIGMATGEDRATVAAKQAIASPLLDISIEGAKGVLFTITGGQDLSMHEVSEIAKIITSTADDNAKVIFGAVIDEQLGDQIKVCVIATGFDGERKPYSGSDKDQSQYTANRFLKTEVPQTPAPAAETKVKQAALAPKKPVMKVEDPEDDDDAVTPFVKRALPDEKKPQLEKQTVGAAEEDLEVPAFLRRKMMQ